MQQSGRHLLGFSPEAESDVVAGPQHSSRPSEMANRYQAEAQQSQRVVLLVGQDAPVLVLSLQ